MSFTVDYRVSPRDPASHLFEVSCTVFAPSPEGLSLSLPAWIPGSYLIREFARNVVWLRAESGGQRIAVEKITKDTWRCSPCDGPITLTYEIYAFDNSVRTAYLDTGRGFFNGTSLFIRAHGHESLPCSLTIDRPSDDRCASWHVATSLSTVSVSSDGVGVYRAENYDDLVDHPVEMGVFDRIEFEAAGVSHEIVITGRHRADMERLRADVQRICAQHLSFFGEAPFPRYVFLMSVMDQGYGGLEHRASTSLICARDALPARGSAGVTDEYRGLLGLVSHEYFHAWNVKRIKPAAFEAYDYQRENYTRLLWVFEGITSYYDDLALVRAGLISQESYLELLSQTITRVLRAPGRFKQSVSDSSFDAWIKFYRQDENAPNALVSYYAKGALIALALDLLLRGECDASLDDVMRALWQRCGKTGKGVAEEGFEALVAEIAGRDLSGFFDTAVRGTEDLPLAELLDRIGVQMQLRAAESESDKGGKPARNTEAPERRAVLGVRWQDGAEAKLAHVLDGSAAQRAGLAPGDTIIAVDGLRASRTNIEKLLAGYTPGTAVRLHAFRRDELFELQVVPQAPPLDTCWLSVQAGADERRRALREAWLTGR